MATSKLEIKVVEAKDLQVSESPGNEERYIVVTVGDSIPWHTKPAEEVENKAVWNQSNTFDLKPEGKVNIKVECKKKDSNAPTVLGGGDVPVADVMASRQDLVVKLLCSEGKPAGEVIISLTLYSNDASKAAVPPGTTPETESGAVVKPGEDAKKDVDAKDGDAEAKKGGVAGMLEMAVAKAGPMLGMADQKKGGAKGGGKDAGGMAAFKPSPKMTKQITKKLKVMAKSCFGGDSDKKEISTTLPEMSMPVEAPNTDAFNPTVLDPETINAEAVKLEVKE